MKKILLTTALLSASAGMAAAEVTFGGYGRFGLEYVEDRNDDSAPLEETQIAMRLRFNINAKVETDSGVTFGGRIRMQYTDGGNASSISPAYVYATYEGMRVEVGNANTAYDSAALMYNSEMGFLDTSAAETPGSYYGFASTSYSGENDRMGIFFSYSVGDFNVRVSHIDPDQQTSGGLAEEPEISVSADYKFGAITVSGAYAQNGEGFEDNDLTFLGAEYAVNDMANVGLLYFGDDLSDLFTLYGNYTFDAITVKAYIGSSEDIGTEDLAYGIGADYDLGGARVSGSIQQNFFGNMSADLGVRFDF